jgi:hypothetical protein
MESANKGATVMAEYSQNGTTEPQVFGLALASVIMSSCSILLGPLGFIPGIICGHLARQRAKGNATVKGFGLASAGLIIGYIFLAIFLLMFILYISIQGPDSSVQMR